MNKLHNFLYSRYLKAGAAKSSIIEVGQIGSRNSFARKIIKKAFPENKDAKILDLGCGSGIFIIEARHCGYFNVRGVDVSADQVAHAKKLGVDVEVRDIFDELASLDSCSVDVILTIDVIEHLEDDYLLLLAQEVFRCLKHDGNWVIHAPNGYSPFVGAIRYGDLTHIRAFTRDSLEQLAGSIGFSSVKVTESAPFSYSIASFIRAIAWQVLRIFFALINIIETGWARERLIFTRNLIAVVTKSVN